MFIVTVRNTTVRSCYTTPKARWLTGIRNIMMRNTWPASQWLQTSHERDP